MYYALSNLEVVISGNKKKARRFAKGLRFAGKDLRFGYCGRQAFLNPDSFRETFGHCIIYDLDQRLVFAPPLALGRRDFLIVRSL